MTGRLIIFLLSAVMIVITLSDAKGQQQRKKLFLSANWKGKVGNGDAKEVDQLCDDLNKMWNSLSRAEKNAIEICVNPPYVYLDRVRTRLNKDIAVGSQNVYDSHGPNGANTGAITPKMLRAVGSEWVLLGHSDRRNNLGETDELISENIFSF